MSRRRDSIPLILLLSAVLARADTIASPNAPFFTAAGVVQAATQTGQTLAPNTIATIYGVNLSWTTHAVTAADLDGGSLPTSLEGVSVYVNGILSNLMFISPGQINFLIPYEINTASATIIVARQGVAGPVGSNGLPSVVIPLASTSPGFFEWNGNFAVAEHADGSLITSTSPAQGGETIVLYAAGLGRTVPDSASGSLPTGPATILYASQMQIFLNDSPLPRASIYYAGVTPGFAGLYQINLTLPVDLPSNPQMQIVIGAQSSPLGILLYAN